MNQQTILDANNSSSKFIQLNNANNTLNVKRNSERRIKLKNLNSDSNEDKWTRNNIKIIITAMESLKKRVNEHLRNLLKITLQLILSQNLQ